MPRAKVPSAKAEEPKPKVTKKRSPRDIALREERRTAAITTEQGLRFSEAAKRANRLKALLDPHTEAMGLVIVNIAKDENVHPSIRMEAASRVLDRVYGKPKETLHLEDSEGSVGEGDEVMKLLNNILRSVGAPELDGPSDKAPGA